LGHLWCRFSPRHLDICAPPAAPHSPPAPFSLCCWTISIRRGSCNPGFIYWLIHRIPQRSFHPFFTTQNFHRPFIATHSFPVRPARLRRLRFAPGPGLSPGCSQPFVTASCLSPGMQFTSSHVPRENKITDHPVSWKKRINLIYYLPE
jgi:hypothetical protein